MKEIYYTYNNEAIASCTILKVIQDVKTFDIARSCLILPFLLDDRTVNYFKTIKDNDLTLEETINIKPRLYSSFNKRYLALLPITINSLMILSKSNQIEINPLISIKNEGLPENLDLGKRFNEIKLAIPYLLKMIEKHDTTYLYKILNIQL